MPENRSIPTVRNPDLVTQTILVGGEELPGTVEVMSITIGREVNRIPFAKLVIKDGIPSEENFPVSGEDYFLPGNEIEIKTGYHGEEEVAFKGIVVKHNIRIREGSSRLYIDCRDAAFKMTLDRRNRYFEEVTDDDAISTIISENGLDLDVESTDVTHQELVQYESTDWDFVLSRADANGLIALVEDGVLIFQKPQLDAEPGLSVVYGSSLLEFDGELDGRNQYEGVKALSWDIPNQEVQEVEAQDPSFPGPGNLSYEDISSGLGNPVCHLRHSGNVKQEELQAWANAKLTRSRLSKIVGRARFQGSLDVKAGGIIELGGLGDRYNGKAFVGGVLHQLKNGQWITEVQLGIDKSWFAEQFDISTPPASSLLPAVQGLQIGLVTTLEGDPEGEFRIKVNLPLVNPTAEGVWARLGCLDAGDSRGVYFRPEIGDEVIVGFINDDPRDAVVLGSLHSSANPSPEEISDDNFKKGYFSKSELRMEFDDEKKIIKLETPGGNKAILDDDDGSITLEDGNGNKIVLNSDGIELNSIKDIIIKASTDFNVDGVNLNLAAQAAAKMEGSASAEVSSSGTTTVKGSVVMIN